MKKRPPKDVRVLQLYFDMNDEKQKNCYDVISKLSRKKSRFISSVVDQFLKNYPNAKDKKTLSFYVEHYEELNNLTPASTASTVVIQDNLKSMVTPLAAVPAPDAEREQDIIDAMSGFTV